MKLFTIFAFLISSTAVFAQESSTRLENLPNEVSHSDSTQLWFNVGPGFSNYFGKVTAGMDSHASFSISAEAEIPLTQHFFFQSGLGFIQKGASLNDSGLDYAMSANYLEIPILAKVKMNHFSLIGGAYLANAVYRNTWIHGIRGGSKIDQNIDSTEVLKSFDYGARFGLAYDLPIQSNLALSAGLNFDLGIANINAKSDTDTVQNRTIMATIGLGVKI